ncbi:MAG TPA: cation transporter [Ardenticatenaceae bacterium]|jgi:copper chaperone
MQKSIQVPNISCGHCTATIEREVSEVSGVRTVHADQATKNVTVEWEEPARWETIEATLREIGYPAA